MLWVSWKKILSLHLCWEGGGRKNKTTAVWILPFKMPRNSFGPRCCQNWTSWCLFSCWLGCSLMESTPWKSWPIRGRHVPQICLATLGLAGWDKHKVKDMVLAFCSFQFSLVKPVMHAQNVSTSHHLTRWHHTFGTLLFDIFVSQMHVWD